MRQSPLEKEGRHKGWEFLRNKANKCFAFNTSDPPGVPGEIPPHRTTATRKSLQQAQPFRLWIASCTIWKRRVENHGPKSVTLLSTNPIPAWLQSSLKERKSPGDVILRAEGFLSARRICFWHNRLLTSKKSRSFAALRMTPSRFLIQQPSKCGRLGYVRGQLVRSVEQGTSKPESRPPGHLLGRSRPRFTVEWDLPSIRSLD